MTLQQLYRNTEQIPTKKRHNVSDEVALANGYKVDKLTDESILVSATTSKQYTPKIKLPVTLVDGEGAAITTTDGEQLTITPPSVAKDDVQVTCTCDDFYFRFATVNSKENVLFGNITRTYVPVGSGHRVAHDVPAVCKHIIKLADTLQRDGIITR